MRIVQQYRSEKWTCQRTCRNCDITLEITEDDLDYDSFKISGMFYDGSAECAPFFCFRCMVCGASNTIKSKDEIETIPNEVRAFLIKRFKEKR